MTRLVALAIGNKATRIDADSAIFNDLACCIEDCGDPQRLKDSFGSYDGHTQRSQQSCVPQQNEVGPKRMGFARTPLLNPTIASWDRNDARNPPFKTLPGH